MKLRMRGDTLRLRLARSEVAALGEGNRVEESTRFPDGSVLRYVLQGGETFAAEQQHQENEHLLLITVPQDQARDWAESSNVGFSGEDPFEVGPLQVLVEKDFTCITPRQGAEELDTYPNPNATPGARREE